MSFGINDPDLIAQMRSEFDAGIPFSQIYANLKARLPSGGLLIMTHFREAFGLSIIEVNNVQSWTAHDACGCELNEGEKALRQKVDAFLSTPDPVAPGFAPEALGVTCISETGHPNDGAVYRRHYLGAFFGVADDGGRHEIIVIGHARSTASPGRWPNNWSEPQPAEYFLRNGRKVQRHRPGEFELVVDNRSFRLMSDDPLATSCDESPPRAR